MPLTDIKLVDAPTPTAAVVYDFNAGKPSASPSRYVLADQLDLGVPELDGDVEAVDAVYRARPIRFKVRVTGSKPEALAIQSAMGRALLNPGPLGRGWLRVQVNPLVKPVWFRTYRPRIDEFDVRNASADAAYGDLWDITVVVPCEAFAYGERVRLTFGGSTTATVAADPTATTNPLTLTLPTIVGELPVPLDVTCQLSSAPGGRTAITVMSHSGPTARPAVHIPIGAGDGVTKAQDCSDPVTDTAYAGGSYREVTFASNTGYLPRLLFPAPTPTPRGGRYRAFMRATSSDPSTVYRFAVSDLTTPVTFSVAGAPTAKGAAWVDLGVLSTSKSIPRSPNGPTVGGFPSATTLIGARVSGSGSLQIDHLMFVPLDVVDTLAFRMLRAQPKGSMTDGTLYVDGTYREVTPSSPSWKAVEGAGTFPIAVPGAANSLHFTFASAPDATDAVTRTAQVTVAYYPRYALLGSGA